MRPGCWLTGRPRTAGGPDRGLHSDRFSATNTGPGREIAAVAACTARGRTTASFPLTANVLGRQQNEVPFDFGSPDRVPDGARHRADCRGGGVAERGIAG